MTRGLLLLLAAAGCALAQQAAAPRPGEELLSLKLTESAQEIAARFGSPVHTAAFGPGYFSWFYQAPMADTHDFSHTFLFSDPARTLVSVTRNFDPEVNIDHLFPAAETETRTTGGEGKPAFHARMRKLSGDRVLIALGSSAGEPCGQLVIIRRSALRFFFAWLE